MLAVVERRETLVYILSTLAQTCAALAAFVGAVGIFRLQVLSQQYAAMQHEFLAGGEMLSGYDCRVRPLAESLKLIEIAEKNPTHGRGQYGEPLRETRRRWQVFPARLTASRRALDEKTAMMITGHRTASIFKRYRIVNLADMERAVARLAYAPHAPANGKQRPALAVAN